MSVTSEAPRGFQPIVWALAAVVAIIGAGGIAYNAVSARAEEIATSKDAATSARISGHERLDDERFARIEKSLDRIERKLGTKE